MSAHVREWDLRRRAAGELAPEEVAALGAHLAGCEACRATELALADERRRFEAALPFEQFEKGVAQRQNRPRRAVPVLRWVQGAVALAASVGFAVAAPRLIARMNEGGATHLNRLKGGAEIELRIAGAGNGPQRVAAERGAEALGPGERVRIGYRAGPHRYVAAIAVDATGEVSPLYPESGPSLPAAAAPQLTYLPGSLEFTGHGQERVIVVLSDEPLDMTRLSSAARTAFQKAGGDVAKLPPLDIAGEQFQRTLLQP